MANFIVVISGWLSTWPGKMEPFEDHLSTTSESLIGLRNKPQ